MTQSPTIKIEESRAIFQFNELPTGAYFEFLVGETTFITARKIMPVKLTESLHGEDPAYNAIRVEDGEFLQIDKDRFIFALIPVSFVFKRVIKLLELEAELPF